MAVADLKLAYVLLDCPDPLTLAGFYAELLGWSVEPEPDGEYVTLRPPDDDSGICLSFQRIDDWVAPTWPGGTHPQQFHLDFSVPDIDAAEPAVLAAGARRHDHQPATDGGFRVFLDPAGHPFCLIR